jgi:hypothetical protein
MQTFLPYKNFNLCARALDRKRLGKQRVEALQILYALTGLSASIVNPAVGEEYTKTTTKKHGWSNHPAVLMWKGHERALIRYGIAMCQEWIRLGYKDTCTKKFLYVQSLLKDASDSNPWWLGDDRLHSSHRSNLIRKDSSFYGNTFKEDDSMPYFWPTRETINEVKAA